MMAANKPEVIKINEHTWRIEDGIVRFFVLEGETKALMIDSGITTVDAKNIASSLTSKPLELLNTHADRDHIVGNGGFDWCYMCAAEEDNYRAAGGTGIIHPIHDGDVIDLGGRPLEIIEIPGHTPGSVAILDINSRVLFSGDSVQGGTIFMFGKFRNMKDFIQSMHKLLEPRYLKRFDTVYPSHGPFPVEPSLIPKLIEGAESISSSSASGKEIMMFGQQVIHYEFPYAGFFCQP